MPLLNDRNELNHAEFSIEKLMAGGYKFIGGISKDLDSKKNLESYFGFGFENCCLAFKVYASDKRLSKYNLLYEHEKKTINIGNKFSALVDSYHKHGKKRATYPASPVCIHPPFSAFAVSFGMFQ